MNRWQKISCAERDIIWSPDLGVAASFTDLDGQYGEPQIRTEWCDRATEESVLRDVRWPSRVTGENLRPCEHYVPATNPGSGE